MNKQHKDMILVRIQWRPTTTIGFSVLWKYTYDIVSPQSSCCFIPYRYRIRTVRTHSSSHRLSNSPISRFRSETLFGNVEFFFFLVQVRTRRSFSSRKRRALCKNCRIRHGRVLRPAACLNGRRRRDDRETCPGRLCNSNNNTIITVQRAIIIRTGRTAVVV